MQLVKLYYTNTETMEKDNQQPYPITYTGQELMHEEAQSFPWTLIALAAPEPGLSLHWQPIGTSMFN